MRINNESWLLNVPIAHRGLHGDVVPENSLLSFEKAVEKGYAIEIDVRFSKCGTVMVFHDDTLDRMTAESGRVIGKTAAELKELKLKGSEENIPTLLETLNLVGGRVPLLVEVKDQPERNDLVEKTLELLKHYKGDFALQSFNPLYVKKFKKLMPDALRGQLATMSAVKSKLKNFLLRNFFFNLFTKPDFNSYDINGIPSRAARKKSRVLITWTIRNYEQLEKARKYADNIIFENIVPD